MRKTVIVGVVVTIFCSMIFLMLHSSSQKEQNVPGQIRYIALGDSYTIGTGVEEEENYPSQLQKVLQKKGIDIALVANPAENGYSTDEVINYELDILNSTKPNFVTILIGANDLVRGMSEEMYEKNLSYIIDQTQQKISNKKHIILLTIPDFSLTPVGAQFGSKEQLQQAISKFNTIIVNEGKRRGLEVVDVYQVSQAVKEKPSLIVSDGLHPTKEQYALWVEKIVPVALSLLKN